MTKEIKIESTNDLLGFLLAQMSSGHKDWFGFPQQRVMGINLVYEIAKRHANVMTPEEVVKYAIDLNNAIYQGFIKVR